jgi:hypothetical protein
VVKFGTVMIDDVTRAGRVMKLWKDTKVPCKVVHVPMTLMTCAGWYFSI